MAFVRPRFHQIAEILLQTASVIEGTCEIEDVEELSVRHFFQLVLCQLDVVLTCEHLQ